MPEASRRRRPILRRLLIVALLVVLTLILLPIDYEDEEHLRLKAEYLNELAAMPATSGRPSFAVVLFDDLGYGDLGAYGSRSVSTPHLDRLAREGMRFTHAYATSPYCSASRAGLLTGRYPVRYGMDHVLQAPWSWPDLLLRLGRRHRRLPSHEITIAEALSAAGYATAIFGKWHLGDHSPSLPRERGFDAFFGLHHSNDQGKPVVWEDETIVEGHPIDQATLTRRYTERAVDFLESRERGEPFFLYLPHTFPHVPLHVAGDRLGQSDGGLYGDVVEELDWSVGQVVAALRRRGLWNETLILVTSDNGPWFQGSPGGVRGRKMGVFEGGMRVPLITSWPGLIRDSQGQVIDGEPGRVIDDPVMGLDLFPTLLELAGLPLPEDRVIDGVGLYDRVTGPRETVHYYSIDRLHAVRQGRFKYHARHRVLYGNPMNFPWGPFANRGPWLFDLETDPDESYDVTARHPEVAARLRALLHERIEQDRRNAAGWL